MSLSKTSSGSKKYRLNPSSILSNGDRDEALHVRSLHCCVHAAELEKGWLDPWHTRRDAVLNPNAKANFAVAGGIKNGSFWGHLMYLDHGNRLRAKGTAVSGYDLYAPFGPNGRQASGLADVGGTAESYEADVADDHDSGRGIDRFQLLLNGVPVASDFLAGGNIQLHGTDCQ